MNEDLVPVKFGCCAFQGDGSVVVDPLLLFPLLVGVLCFVMQYLVSFHILQSSGSGRESSKLYLMFLLSCVCFSELDMGDSKNNASISLINVYRLSKADLLLKLILRYVINVFLASCQVSLL